MNATAPIGIFDSGVGGLTVTRALSQHLPNEDLIYFGDTAHTPWGDKSKSAIRTYVQRITDLLISKQCKLILIACNTASATAYEFLQEHTDQKIPIINVIDPVIAYLKENYAQKKIGLIGTKQTIHSNTYEKKIQACQRNIQLKSLATALLCPLVEEGLPLDHPLNMAIVEVYLSNPILQDIEALILGCTHYSILKPVIESYYQNKVNIIDSENIIANKIEQELKHKKLLNLAPKSEKTFYISDHNTFFATIANRFFQEKITLSPLKF